MPAAVAGAAIGGAASLGGALLGKSSQDKALKAQEKARQEALAYEREQARKAEEAAAKREALYERQYNDWLRTQDKLLSRYGIKRTSTPLSLQGAPPGMGGMPPGAPGMGAPMSPGMPVGAGMTGRAPMRLKSLGMAQPAPMVNPYALNEWSEWDA